MSRAVADDARRPIPESGLQEGSMSDVTGRGSQAEPTRLRDAAQVDALHRDLAHALLRALALPAGDRSRLDAVASAEALIIRLATMLDRRAGGELPGRLGALYRYMGEALRGAPDDECLDELLELAARLQGGPPAPAAGRRGSAGIADSSPRTHDRY
jgi:hypothetical protein